MTAKPNIIPLLNEQLLIERSASTSYRQKAAVLKNQGFLKLAAKYAAEAAEENGHAQEIIDRIIFLEGEPDLISALPDVYFLEDVQDMLTDDMSLEKGALEHLKKVCAYTENPNVLDYATSEIIRKQISATEEHIDWVEAQIYLIKRVGLENFLHSWV